MSEDNGNVDITTGYMFQDNGNVDITTGYMFQDNGNVDITTGYNYGKQKNGLPLGLKRVRANLKA